MDFDHAIAAHASWKAKLAKYLKSPDHSLQPAEIALDNQCELGKWIAGEGKKFANLEEYRTVKSNHARFHRVASNIVQRANAGEQVAEEIALGTKSDFASASSAVVRAIMALKMKVGTPVNA
jgi:methyl-accepting chemotaxis protein